jgi:sphinganine C4-monooxygenase
MDTWQYWWHRTFHTYTYLYRKIHSVHHRLYVPYAFGALYNHPLEGIILDTLGAAVAHEASRMTMRQAIVLFAFASAKTVDDFYNNSDYHDIHHQAYGIKANFSQPFL